MVLTECDELSQSTLAQRGCDRWAAHDPSFAAD
jgi:hypothetical protein